MSVMFTPHQQLIYHITSNNSQVPIKCRVSIKHHGLLSDVQINAGSLIIAGSPINAGPI